MRGGLRNAAGLALLVVSSIVHGAGDAARGERIFLGREGVPARLAGHDRPLPPHAARCAACHEPARRAGAPQEDLAPPLNPDTLTRAMPRRGGKPYAYDRDSFCSTLRTGIDPQYVVMRRAMPRFDATAEQCAALWSYLTRYSHDRQR